MVGVSMLDVQHNAILSAIREAGRGEWKVLVVDQYTWKLITNVVKEEEILNEHIANIEQIEQRRATNRDMDAIYILAPEAHIVDCVMADLERRRYRRTSLLWTSILPAPLREKIDKIKTGKELISQLKVLDIGYYPRESNLVTFRDPWSFPVLYHPQCNNLVQQHIADLAQKVRSELSSKLFEAMVQTADNCMALWQIVSVCVSLGEYPTIRYFKQGAASHEAGVLCTHLARFVQDSIDMYATYHSSFPPPSARPRAMLYILDRSLDLIAPLVHEFTYQAMVHDLLPMKEGGKVTYRVVTNEGRPDQQDKELEVSEKDKLWTSNRHRHMKDTIERLMGEFQTFLEENPHFANTEASNANSLNAIKDMLAGLPQFQEKKEAYSLHLSMAQECMNVFQRRKLPDLASVEQSLATGLDEDYKKPRNLADQVVRALDEESIAGPDRLRLLLLYLLYRDGLLPADITKLLAHAQLPSQNGEVIDNLRLLGARIARPLKDPRPSTPSLFQRKTPSLNTQEDYSLSRFEPALKSLLEEHSRGLLDQNIFPYTKPQLDPSEDGPLGALPQASLRNTKPTWAKRGAASTEPRQRVIVFMAGGATYSESRACYEITRDLNKDVYLITSHMLTPSLFIRQVGDLSIDKRKLGIPAEQPKAQAPAHLWEAESSNLAPAKPTPPSTSTSGPPTAAMGNMRLSTGTGDARQQNGTLTTPASVSASQSGVAKQVKDPEKKKRLFPSFKK